MFQYLIKRLAFAIPTWLVISVVIFNLSQCTSGDAVGGNIKRVICGEPIGTVVSE